MRTMTRVKMQVEADNRAFQDGTLSKTMMEAIERLKPEAACFYPDQGLRTALMVLDVKDSRRYRLSLSPFSRGSTLPWRCFQ